MFPPKKKTATAGGQKKSPTTAGKNPVDKYANLRKMSEKSKRVRQSESIGKHLASQM